MSLVFHYGADIPRENSRGMRTIGDVVKGPVPGPVIGVTTFFEKDTHVGKHWHDHSQFVFAASGTMVVTAAESIWLVPPNRAVWLPAMTEHSFHMPSPVEMHTINILSTMKLPDKLQQCCVLQVSSFLKELVAKVRQFHAPYSDASPQRRIVDVLLDEIEAAPTTPLFAPFPKDPRLQRLANEIANSPGDNRTLSFWASQIGASERTIARLFRKDVGMTFVQWRQQIRLLLALQLLAKGQRVTDVAIELGYDSTSAFINLFKRNLGATPSRYFSE